MAGQAANLEGGAVVLPPAMHDDDLHSLSLIPKLTLICVMCAAAAAADFEPSKLNNPKFNNIPTCILSTVRHIWITTSGWKGS